MRFPYQGAGIALFTNDSLLIGKRSKKPFKNLYSIPGGGFEKTKDKNFFDCAKRELKEETSIDLDSIKYIECGKWNLRFPFFKWTTYFIKIESTIDDLIPSEFYNLKFEKFKDIEKNKMRPFSRLEIKIIKKKL